jgi:hypothetical protein
LKIEKVIEEGRAASRSGFHLLIVHSAAAVEKQVTKGLEFILSHLGKPY